MKPVRYPHNQLTISLLLFLCFVIACKKDPDPVAKSSAKALSSFTFGSLSPAVAGSISGNTITATVPFGTALTALAPTIVVSEKATVSPASGVAKDFSNAVTYTVTAEDGSTQVYTVNVGVGKSPAKELTGFSFNGLTPAVNATIDPATKVISATLPAGTDATKLVPTITLSPKATITPATSVAQDFSKAVTYTVTAEDGTTQAYSATITVAQPVNNGTVYIGNLDGYLYAMDALTGAKKWEFKTGDAIQATPTVVNGVLYIASWDKKLYALDAATGAKKWESNPTAVVLNQPFAAPMVVNGLLYYGGDIAMYCLDASTGTKKWEFVGDGIYSWQASPTVVDGVVYGCIRGSAGGLSGLYALNATTGAVKWHQTAIGISESSPAVANGLLYAGSEGAGFNAFDLATGAPKWQAKEVTTVNSSPTVVNGIAYIGSGIFGTDNQNLYALDALTGAKKWAFPTPDGGTYYSSPMVANGIVYVGGGGTFYAVDAATGAEKWKVKLDVGNLIWSGSVVATGLVYIGIGKKIFAFDAATGAKKWEYETTRTIDHSSPCVLAKDGTVYHAGISGMVQ